ncbi:MAG: glycosyltransferase family 4 protein [Xenococcaceae cyanobacterium MO_207.B15]|nr:glycosyltransferase family 4 protein [Xenococcaceae cyanobacterium MO_207.B15]
MTNKNRVLFIVRFLWGDEGISVGLVRLARGLIENGWEVGLASAMVEPIDKKGKLVRGPQWFESHGIKHFFVPFPNLRTSPSNIKQVFVALQKLHLTVAQFKPNIINIHSLSMTPYAQAMRIWHQIPVVSTARVEPDVNRFDIKLSSLINKYLNKFLGDRFIAISTEIKDIYQNQLAVPATNIRLVCHGVDENYFRPPSSQEKDTARKAFGLSSESKVICLIGRIDPVKGHEILFRSIALLKSEGYKIVALCAGTGGRWEDEIKSKVFELDVADSVKFLGYTNSRQVLWSSEVLVLPSKREGFAWVIPEAMLCGVIPIRTPGAGSKDQIEDGKNGFIIPFNDYQKLAEIIKQVLETKTLKTKLSLAAIESAKEKFTAKIMIDKTIAVYEEVIKQIPKKS